VRTEDKQAFVEEYLELCRKYGVLINVNSKQEEQLVDHYDDVIDLELHSTAGYSFKIYSYYLKGLV